VKEKPAILFLCIHNAGRSQIAAAFAREIGGERVTVYSAGTAPGEVLNPSVVRAMNEVGIEIGGETPTKVTDAMARRVDVIVTMGCGDECPYYPGKRYDDWELRDPAGQTLDVIRLIRDDIEERVRLLLIELVSK
jgi:arsenate reductase